MLLLDSLFFALVAGAVLEHETKYNQVGRDELFFAGKTPNRNKNISLTNFIIKSFEGTGIYIRGEDHTFQDGCVYGGIGPNARAWYINGDDSRTSNLAKYSIRAARSAPATARWDRTFECCC